MSKYIKMPIAANNPIYTFADFKEDFEEVTGIEIVTTPKNAQETHYLIADQRITQAHIDELKSRWPMVGFTHTVPQGWTVYDNES